MMHCATEILLKETELLLALQEVLLANRGGVLEAERQEPQGLKSLKNVSEAAKDALSIFSLTERAKSTAAPLQLDLCNIAAGIANNLSNAIRLTSDDRCRSLRLNDGATTQLCNRLKNDLRLS
jgi:hypothetical protein